MRIRGKIVGHFGWGQYGRYCSGVLFGLQDGGKLPYNRVMFRRLGVLDNSGHMGGNGLPSFMRSVVLATGILGLGFLTNVSASGLSGSYNYTYVGDTSSLGCSPTTRNDFASTSGGNSIAIDPVSFSICAGVPGALAGGEFNIGSGGNTASGVFSGIFVGLSAGNGDIFDGTFDLTSTSGYYDAAAGSEGIFQVVTGNVNNVDTNPGDYLTGTFDFVSTPEPATTALIGSGLLLLLFRRRRNDRPGGRQP